MKIMNIFELGILAHYFQKNKAEENTIKEIAEKTHISQTNVKKYLKIKGWKAKIE